MLCVLLSLHAFAQPCPYIFSGHIEDADIKEKLVFATITIKELNLKVVSDEKGNFRFNKLCSGLYTIVVTHVNCEPFEKKITLKRDFHLDIFLPHARTTLGEIILESQKGVPNSGFKKEISGRDLDETRAFGLAESLSKLNGVTTLQTGSNISKPVIHGLHSSRILTINNGVRQEGQQWGNEHASEIDPFIATRLTVIKGVDELRYGSDAIGGVIIIEPKALPDKPGARAELNTVYFTNNREYVFSGLFEQQLKKLPPLSYRLQGTFKQAANSATPDYRVNNTAFRERDYSLTANWKKGLISTELFYSYFTSKLGIFSGSHIGNLTDLQTAIAAPQPESVFLGQNTYKLNRPYQQVAHQLVKSKSVLSKNKQKLSLLLAAQSNRRQEFDVVRTAANKNPQLDLSISTLTEELSCDHRFLNHTDGAVGISLMQQENNYGGRYFIPNYFANSYGAFVIEKWRRHKWELQAGIRYDYKTINTSRLKFNNSLINYDFKFSTLATSLNVVYNPSNSWRVNINTCLASRAPYVNELLSDGIHHGTATYEKGNIFLKPEKAFNLVGGLNYQNTLKTFLVDLILYSNRIRDFIYQQPQPDNPVLTIAGAFPLIEYRQSDAVLNGFDFTATLSVIPKLNWSSKISVLHARNKALNDWLILMPANRFSNEATWNFKDSGALRQSHIAVEWNYVTRQTHVPSLLQGRQDYKDPPGSYHLLNLSASTIVRLHHLPVTIGIGIKNILNTRYRDYLNSMRYFVDEPGRNINIRFKIPIALKSQSSNANSVL